MAHSSSQELLDEFTIDSVIRGHHVYKEIWTPFVGEELTLTQENGNCHDRYAITVEKENDIIVGRVPRELSKIFRIFMEGGGLIKCEVTGRRKRGKGLEVPCTYKCHGSKQLISKLKKSLKLYPLAVGSSSCPY